MNPAKKFRAACYTVEGINSFAVVIYFNYLYFFFRDKFGFDDKQNLELAALIGFIYVFASWQAGKFAQRCGYFTALKIGFGVMAAGLAAGSQLHSVAGAIAAACVVNVGMCFTWPVLEALVSEGADAARAVGIYNITWAVNNAAAFFIGGTLIEQLGYQSIFYVPLALMLLQFAMVFWLKKKYPKNSTVAATPSPRPNGVRAGVRGFDSENQSPPHPDPLPLLGGEGEKEAARAKNFQRMAWLANPFAYIAINTLIAVLPGIAAKFNLSTSMAGFVCSLWCFARVFAFVTLWRWTAWHYKFRWLAGSFALLIVSFAVILVVQSLAIVLLAQIFFGAAIGLIYYSSLFYSMNASDTKSEHGGIHEAAIGAGNCIGPAVGALSLQFLPQSANSGAVAVSVLLLCGLGGLLGIWKSAR